MSYYAAKHLHKSQIIKTLEPKQQLNYGVPVQNDNWIGSPLTTLSHMYIHILCNELMYYRYSAICHNTGDKKLHVWYHGTKEP